MLPGSAFIFADFLKCGGCYRAACPDKLRITGRQFRNLQRSEHSSDMTYTTSRGLYLCILMDRNDTNKLESVEDGLMPYLGLRELLGEKNIDYDEQISVID